MPFVHIEGQFSDAEDDNTSVKGNEKLVELKPKSTEQALIQEELGNTDNNYDYR